jgi:hypothetical protein
MASLAAEAAFLALFTGKTAAKKVPLSFSPPLTSGACAGHLHPEFRVEDMGGHLDSRLVGVRHLAPRNSNGPAMPPVGAAAPPRRLFAAVTADGAGP